MADQGLTLVQKQAQRIAVEQQRLLGQMLEKNDAEMAEFIDNKVNEIQALEKKNDDSGDAPGDADDQQRQDTAATSDGERKRDADAGGDDDEPAEQWFRYLASNRSRDDEYIEPIVVSEKTLQDSLHEQLGELELDETQLVIAQAIVGNIADDGYLRRSASEIADDVTFNDGYTVDAAQVEQMLHTVQTLDPPGIAARDIRECLLLQLERKRRDDDVALAIKMVKNHFDDMAGRRFDAIARRLDVDVHRLEEVFDTQIRRGLNAKPGNAFSSRTEMSVQVTPDFDIELDEDNGRITVTLRNNIPALQISESYEMMNERYKSGKALSVKETKDKKRIIDAYQRASMFIEVLRQRQETLFNTMSAIVQCQRDYFISGNERDLKPLGQQQIADMIGKDVTVVSRAVSNKYVQMPWGVKALKSFFSEDINGASRHEVYDDLKKLIENEDKKHPLSDDALCEQLKAMGYRLERRTVAKYRETLQIPSSTVRRKMAK